MTHKHEAVDNEITIGNENLGDCNFIVNKYSSCHHKIVLTGAQLSLADTPMVLRILSCKKLTLLSTICELSVRVH